MDYQVPRIFVIWIGSGGESSYKACDGSCHRLFSKKERSKYEEGGKVTSEGEFGLIQWNLMDDIRDFFCSGYVCWQSYMYLCENLYNRMFHRQALLIFIRSSSSIKKLSFSKNSWLKLQNTSDFVRVPIQNFKNGLSSV